MRATVHIFAVQRPLAMAMCETHHAASKRSKVSELSIPEHDIAIARAEAFVRDVCSAEGAALPTALETAFVTLKPLDGEGEPLVTLFYTLFKRQATSGGRRDACEGTAAMNGTAETSVTTIQAAQSPVTTPDARLAASFRLGLLADCAKASTITVPSRADITGADDRAIGAPMLPPIPIGKSAVGSYPPVQAPPAALLRRHSDDGLGLRNESGDKW